MKSDKPETRTAAQREADKAFKQPTPGKKLSEAEEASKSFDDNRERLKAERLARESGTRESGK